MLQPPQLLWGLAHGSNGDRRLRRILEA